MGDDGYDADHNGIPDSVQRDPVVPADPVPVVATSILSDPWPGDDLPGITIPADRPAEVPDAAAVPSTGPPTPPVSAPSPAMPSAAAPPAMPRPHGGPGGMLHDELEEDEELRRALYEAASQ